MINALAVLLSLITCLHDFHVSITYAELNPHSGNLEIAMKVFTDDLEAAITDDTGHSFKIASSGRSTRTDSLMFNYVLRHFSLSADGRKLEIEPVGHEVEQDIILIYLQVAPMPYPKRLRVRNTLFLDRFDDQSNIVNIKVDSEVQSAFLEKARPEKRLVFH